VFCLNAARAEEYSFLFWVQYAKSPSDGCVQLPNETPTSDLSAGHERVASAFSTELRFGTGMNSLIAVTLSLAKAMY
jgi:hypothetical protein